MKYHKRETEREMNFNKKLVLDKKEKKNKSMIANRSYYSPLIG